MLAQSCQVVSLTIASQNTTVWEIKKVEREAVNNASLCPADFQE